MQILLALSFLAVAAMAMPNVLQFHQEETSEWEDFKAKHGKEYHNQEEETYRMVVFHKNLERIRQHNMDATKSYSLGINQFSDLEAYEVKAKLNGFRQPELTEEEKAERLTYMSPALPVELPTEVDWRKHGYVTPVKNQGECGSCWAFSTTGCLEGQHFRKTKKLVSLSEQNLVDCSGSFGNQGCEGGLMDYAYMYIKKNGGLDTEKSYPYEAKDEPCHFEKQGIGATDKGYVDIPRGSEEKLQEAVATIGPISIAIDAGHPSFQSYKEGIYDEPLCSSTQLDHGVLAVGYGTENGTDYWLVKNSWSENWGMNGYIKMVRNKNNQCGVATYASYPLV